MEALVNFPPGACGARGDLCWLLSCVEHLVYRLEFDCYVLVIENLSVLPDFLFLVFGVLTIQASEVNF